MKPEKRVRWAVIASLAVFSLLASAATATAQTQDPPDPNPEPQRQMQGQAVPIPNLGDLNLTPEQIQRIRTINAELKEQRQTAGMRLRQAQRSLAETMESPNQNEALIDERSRDVADAQAATIRLRALSEFRILQVLTPEQRIKLREMRIAQRQRRLEQQRVDNNQRPRVFRRGEAFQKGRLRPGPNPNRDPPPAQQQLPKP